MTQTTAPTADLPTPRPAAGSPLPPTVEQRVHLGKTARHAVPLERHADLGVPDVDVLSLLARDERGRIPELLPIRHARMVASPFAFYRGAAAVMATDLGALPDSGLYAQLCGDAHLGNFGVFATPERRLVLDVNDFDETLPGPFEWDVKRLAASIVLAARANGHRPAEARRAVLVAVGEYRKTVRRFAKLSNLAVWYASLDLERALSELRPDAAARARARGRLRKARGKNSARALRKLTERGDGRVRFRSEPPLLVRLADLMPAPEAEATRGYLTGILDDYRASLADDRHRLLDQFTLVDVARKVVGVGSVGARAWVLLLTGRDDADPLVLQAKEARASVLERYCGPSAYDNSGRRVVEGQRVVQAASDIFLGWVRVTGLDGLPRDFYVRQLWDGKASAEVETMDPRHLRLYGALCAWTLARAHARSGDRVAIAAYLGKKEAFEHAVTEFAERYADRSEAQHQVLRSAVDSGAVTAAG